MPWIDYEGLSRPRRILVWIGVVVLAVAIASVLWLLGVRPSDMPSGK